ncbi:MAG: hypothetical protein FWD31_08370 [Planctomycetaceae bacterium]|nr:hypothetical protein [Planctomycetaceae bacterium]
MKRLFPLVPIVPIALCLVLTFAATCRPCIFAEDAPLFDFGGDPMRYLENDRLKVGIDLSIGGAVTFLTDRENGGENMINSADWGRQIQLSFYSGPRPFIGPNGEQPTPGWAGLGWNPIQSGDCGDNRSKVTHFAYEDGGELRGKSMRVRCIPMQWPHTKGVSGDYEFECLYTLEDNILLLKATIFVNRPDKTQYDACGQEMPALYTNGAWYKLMTYLGDKPFQNEPLTVIVDKNDGKGWPWCNFNTPERWAALIDDNGMGIGVYQADAIAMTTGFHGGDANKGHGGVKSGQTGYIAPLTRQILDHNITWGYETAFVLGTIDDIRGYAQNREAERGLPAWSFQDSRDGWFYGGGAKDKGWPIAGALDIEFPAGGKLIGPDTFLPINNALTLEIEAAFVSADANVEEATVTVTVQPFGPSDMTDWLGWSEGAQNAEAQRREKAETFPVAPAQTTELTVRCDGVHRVWRVPLGEIVTNHAAIKSMSLTFNAPGSVKIKRIGLH